MSHSIALQHEIASATAAAPVGVLKRFADPLPNFSIIGESDTRRAAAEQYISSVFRKEYGAQITHFLPALMSMSCMGKFSSVVGMRLASNGPLFAEQYLDVDVGSLLSAHAGHAVERGSIVEIGNLVATQRGASQLAFVMLAAVMERLTMEWVVFTATRHVQSILDKMRFDSHVICPANPQRLRDSQDQWGTYYSTSPCVIALNVADSVQQVKRSPLASAMYGLLLPHRDALAFQTATLFAMELQA